ISDPSVSPSTWPTGNVTNDELYTAYCEWCKTTHQERPINKIVFGQTVTKYLRKGGKKAHSVHGVRTGKLNTPAEVKKLLPRLEFAHLEQVELLWTNRDLTTALLGTD